MEVHQPEYRSGTVYLRRLFDLLLLAGFSYAFLWLIVKLGAMCPAVLDLFVIGSVY